MRLSPDASVGDLARAGALGRAVKRVWAGWREGAIIEDMEDKFPGLAQWKYAAVLLLAKQGVSAAKLLRAMARNQPLPESEIPTIPD